MVVVFFFSMYKITEGTEKSTYPGIKVCSILNMIAVTNILWGLDTPKEPNKTLDNLLFERLKNILVHLLSNSSYHFSFTV